MNNQERDALIEVYFEAWRNLFLCDAPPGSRKYERAGGFLSGVVRALNAAGFSPKERAQLHQGFYHRLEQEQKEAS